MWLVRKCLLQIVILSVLSLLPSCFNDTGSDSSASNGTEIETTDGDTTTETPEGTSGSTDDAGTTVGPVTLPGDGPIIVPIVTDDPVVAEAWGQYRVNLLQETGEKGYRFIQKATTTNSVDDAFAVGMCYCSIYYHGKEAVIATDPDTQTRIVIWRGNYDVEGTLGSLGSIFLKNKYSSGVGVYGSGAEICIYKKATYNLAKPVPFPPLPPLPDGQSLPVLLPPITNCTSDQIGGTKLPPVHDLRIDLGDSSSWVSGFLNGVFGSQPNPVSALTWWGIDRTFKLPPDNYTTEDAVPHFCGEHHVYHLCSRTVVQEIPVLGSGYWDPPVAIWHQTGYWPWEGYWESPVWYQTGYQNIYVEEFFWTTDCDKSGFPHTMPTWVTSCDSTGFPHTITTWHFEPLDQYINRYNEKYYSYYDELWNSCPYVSAEHYMPYSYKNFTDPYAPLIEMRLVSKVTRGDVKKGDVIVSDKSKTWWLNVWTGGDGVKNIFGVDKIAGSDIQWDETVLYFKIEGYFGNKWVKWDNGKKEGGTLFGTDVTGVTDFENPNIYNHIED